MFVKFSSFIMSIIMFICSFLGINLGGKEIGDEVIQYNKDNTAVTIVLEENGSTGYKWNCKISDDKILVLTADDYYVANVPKGMVGAPGKRAFTFKGLAEGETTVSFSYERDWEKGSVETVTVKVTVAKDLTVKAEIK